MIKHLEEDKNGDWNLQCPHTSLGYYLNNIRKVNIEKVDIKCKMVRSSIPPWYLDEGLVPLYQEDEKFLLFKELKLF